MPIHLVEWAAHAGGIDATTAGGCRRAIARNAVAAGRLLRRAIALRAAIHRAGSAIAHGEAAAENDLRTIKELASHAVGASKLVPRPDGYRFDFSAASPEIALLGPVSWSAVEILAAGQFHRLKQCPAEGCGWLFTDLSKNSSRRWCDMATCGNRTKVARHRARP